MIKKYFAMSIIATTVALAACSSGNNAMLSTEEACAAAAIANTPLAGCDVGEQEMAGVGTAFDVIAASAVHTRLEAALAAVGLDTKLDTEDTTLTVFAPTDAAFDDYDAAVAAGLLTTNDDTDDLVALSDFTTVQLVRILLNHVIDSTGGSTSTLVVGSLPTLAIAVDGTSNSNPPLEVLYAQNLMIALDSTSSLYSVTSDSSATAAVIGTAIIGTEANTMIGQQDVVHVVDALLLPSDLPADDNFENGGIAPGGGDDTAAGALIGSGTAYSVAGGAFLSNFGADLNNSNGNSSTFMFFVPSNAAMSTGGVLEADLTVPNQQRHIATTVTALTDGGTITTVGDKGDNHAVAADGIGGFTVGGFAVTLLGSTPEGGEIYGIEGILPSAS